MSATDLIATLERLGEEFLAAIQPLADEQAIRAAQAQFLKGRLSEVMKGLSKLPPADRKSVGQGANKVKQLIESHTADKLGQLADAAAKADLARKVDVTLPDRPVAQGRLHLLTQVRLESVQIFSELGFVVAEGPQIETDWHTFEALAIPKDHPARDMQDTFYLGDEILLRTHTSPVQIRTMLTQEPPIRIVAPGVVYRRDDDATHSPMFSQIEGLAVDESISFADLKGVLIHFVSRLFQKDLDGAVAPELLPVRRARRRDRHAVRVLPRQGAGGVDVPDLQGHRLGRDRRLRHGRPRRVRELQGRPGEVHRVRVRDGARAHGDASPRRQRHQVLLRRRHPLPGAVLMKVSWNWLLELVDLDHQPTVEEGAHALTRGGIEVEGMTDLGAGFSGVVVAEVVGKKPHPQSDKLTLVDVITERGGAATQVVCGAPNVPDPNEHRKVLWAQVGATLPNGMTLEARPIRGIESPGMLCAEDELGLGDDHAGIVVLDAGDPVPLGAPAQRALLLDDWVFDLNAPANRGDVLGHLGVARELVAMLRGKVVPPDVDLSELMGDGDPHLPAIQIADAALCARYTARVIDGVRVAPSPRRIAQRLRAVGVRPISNLVDVTNYVLFELGQPLHAFDAHKLTSGRIEVSPAAAGERFTTLDSIERTLLATDVVIRDGDRSVALAGVMGGLHSEVTEETTRVLLEAASFQPLAIRRTARRLGLHSESSYRFERGVDPELASLASARAARLLCTLGGGRVLGELADTYPGKRPRTPIEVRMERLRTLTGIDLDAATCCEALQRLGCVARVSSLARATPVSPSPAAPDLRPASPRSLTLLEVTPPSARADVTREVDVIEEILRVVGYEQVASTVPALRTPPHVQPDRIEIVRAALAAAGAHEAITFGFQSVERNQALGLVPTDRRSNPIALRNPMSADQAVMRTSLIPNLVAAVAHNQSHGRPDVVLFEIGHVFLRRGGGITERELHELADEPMWAAGVLAGKRTAQLGDGTPWDVFDAKALALVAIRAMAGDVAIEVQAVDSVSYLHPGVAGSLSVDGTVIGWFGEVHPDTRKRLGVEGPAFAFDLDLSALPLAEPRQMSPIPRFPGSTRDVSILLAETIPAARVAQVIGSVNEPLVSGVRLLEDYRDPKLGDGLKSMLWTIAYRAGDRTLTDGEVDKAHEAIVGRLIENLPAQRR